MAGAVADHMLKTTDHGLESISYVQQKYICLNLNFKCDRASELWLFCVSKMAGDLIIIFSSNSIDTSKASAVSIEFDTAETLCLNWALVA